jgi:3-hydroxyacyl-[acyl-carrier-protein] dehydratase
MLIDKVISLDDQKIVARKTLTLNEDIFEYHFPENPVMPAAFMAEAAIQLARVFCWHKTDFQMTLVPIEYKKLTFYKGMGPDQTLTLQVSFLQGEPPRLLDNVDIYTIGTQDEMKVFEGKIKCKYISFDGVHDLTYCRRFHNFILKEILQ